MAYAQSNGDSVLDVYNGKTFTEMPEITELPKEYSDFVRVAALVVGLPICVLSFAGNLLTIVAVVKTKSLQTGANVFIVGLSVSDMMYGTFIVPIIAFTHWNNGWVFGDGFCATFGFLVYLFVMESINNLVGIAFSRYLKILHPQTFERVFRGGKRTVCLLVTFWLLPLITLTPAVILQKFGYDPNTISCTFIREENLSLGLLLLSFFCIPLSFITFCYLRILCKVVSNHRRVEKILPTMSSSQKRSREDYRYTWTMMTIFIVFLLAYMPYVINTVVYPEAGNLTACFLCSVPVWLSNCVNPLVYTASNKQFRLAFWAILTCRKTDFVPADRDESPKSNRISMKTLSGGSNTNIITVNHTPTTNC